MTAWSFYRLALKFFVYLQNLNRVTADLNWYTLPVTGAKKLNDAVNWFCLLWSQGFSWGIAFLPREDRFTVILSLAYFLRCASLKETYWIKHLKSCREIVILREGLYTRSSVFRERFMACYRCGRWACEICCCTSLPGRRLFSEKFSLKNGCGHINTLTIVFSG